MFKPVPMIHLWAFVLARDERALSRLLGRMGLVHLICTKLDPECASMPAGNQHMDWVRLQQVSASLGRVCGSLELVSPLEPTAMEEITPGAVEESLRSVEEKLTLPLRERQRLQVRLAELSAVGERMSNYRGLELPLDQPNDASFLHFITGSLPVENLDAVRVGADVALLPLTEQNGRQHLIVMTTPRRRPELDQLLLRSGFQPDVLPVVAGATVDVLNAQNELERKRVTQELEEVNGKLRALAREFAPRAAQIEAWVDVERLLLEAERNFARTENAAILTGWVPGADFVEVEQGIRKITNEHCIIRTEAPEKLVGEEVPVLLRPPRWLRPFEKLVTTYGLPEYHELEPTLFVAVSFVLMFGMMFGDVGHGAVLGSAGLIALLASGQSKVRKAGWLLLAVGASSVLFGFGYGSCFGLSGFRRFALWQDPIEGDPMNLMLTAMGFGVGLISLALILNVINRFRRRDFIGAWLDKFGIAGIVFYWGTLALLANLAAIRSRNLLTLAIVLFLVLPFIGWVLKEPLELIRDRRIGRSTASGQGWLVASAESLVGAFEAVLSLVANSISFVRLAAYAMSHAALLMAVFLVADAMRRLPAAGAALSVAVVILGNLGVVALEGVVASVQAMRLEYYEFFSKFFPGSGRPFQPFRLQTKLVAGSPL